jgi:hypothetical protein
MSGGAWRGWCEVAAFLLCGFLAAWNAAVACNSGFGGSLAPTGSVHGADGSSCHVAGSICWYINCCCLKRKQPESAARTSVVAWRGDARMVLLVLLVLVAHVLSAQVVLGFCLCRQAAAGVPTGLSAWSCPALPPCDSLLCDIQPLVCSCGWCFN